ncbi:MAG TPA: LutB/LldF family L-lactate oxidation iron-sulfur protein [Verrucomicrobiota bacterium]|nr:LutB/LldF family L-lactate oxidation iron-sulfur protein [Verrucomicrobiota bacterium]HPU56633.1 LutB/LldF family L-lactate oxidation iron-sulfur protein [Verrucomicrobiota bacterium]
MSAPVQQFKSQADVVSRDLRHREFIQTALNNYAVVRDKNRNAFRNYPAARQAAAETKWEAIHHLDRHLEQLATRLEARGTHVHWASTGEQARDIILDIIRRKNARSIIKSKAMTSEEIHLNEALEREGFEVVESDLGEFIVQLRKETPYHIVFPAMHLRRGEIRDLFNRELNSGSTEDPEELTMVARRVLRQKYIQADIGFTGANFAIAETGMISITENEGNARLTAALPKTMVTLLGIEKVLPRLEDLALFLPLLATSGTGQPLTCYNTLYGGPRRPAEPDGPEEYHVVLLDNRRTQILANPEQRDALHCIRCGACLNVCPIFRNVGGHTYGTTYSGPIGSVITPHLRGLQEWKHLSYSSSLCGACTETCPVKIDLAHHLLQNRRNATQQKPSWPWKIGFKLMNFVFKRPALYWFVPKLGRIGQALHPIVKGTRLDPAYAWTRSRETPRIARQTFREWWRGRG